MNLNNAEIAVTTQHLIDIKNYRDYWLHMSDYSDMGEFLCACLRLFPGEEETGNTRYSQIGRTSLTYWSAVNGSAQTSSKSGMPLKGSKRKKPNSSWPGAGITAMTSVRMIRT